MFKRVFVYTRRLQLTPDMNDLDQNVLPMVCFQRCVISIFFQKNLLARKLLKSRRVECIIDNEFNYIFTSLQLVRYKIIKKFNPMVVQFFFQE